MKSLTKKSKVKITLPKSSSAASSSKILKDSIDKSKPLPLGYIDDHLKSDVLSNVIKATQTWPKALILTRVGGFFEAYYDQAITLSKLLSFAIGEKSFSNSKIPMSGFPLHQLNKHVRNLVTNHSMLVAINDQFYNHSTGSFERRVTRVISPGTIIDEDSLDPNSHNFLLAINFLDDNTLSLAWTDLSTGDSFSDKCNLFDLKSFLANLTPSEIVLNTNISLTQSLSLNFQLGNHQSIISYATTSDKSSISLLNDRIMNSFLDEKLNLIEPDLDHNKNNLILDAQTIKGLELKSNMLKGSTSGTLLKSIRRTSTQFGSRLLERWLCEPSTDNEIINQRLDIVEVLIGNTQIKNDLRVILKNIEDGPRLLQRVLLGFNFKPSVLLSLKRIIDNTDKIVALIKDNFNDRHLPQQWKSFMKLLDLYKPLTSFSNKIDNVIIEDVLREKEQENLNINEDDNDDNNMLNISQISLSNSKDPDYYSDDFKRSISKNYSVRIKNLNEKLDKLYKHRLELSNKIRLDFNVNDNSQILLRSSAKLGHYVIAKKIPKSIITSNNFQVIAQSKSLIYFSHPNWTKIKSEIIQVSETLETSEKEALNELKEELNNLSNKFKDNNLLISQIDVLTSFAQLASELNWVRPVITDNKTEMNIINGRHPTVESSLNESLNTFTPNDLIMNDNNFIHAIVGPNMGGKSTFLRQNALIVILAQSGSFVPATSAKIGKVDRIFSRIGATDDLSGGRSTFMVEMTEAAEILNKATERSLVIMDEIGRGTTSIDGISLAYSILLYLLNENKSRTLFATHFHELIDMLNENVPIEFYSTDMKEIDQNILFTHKLRRGVNRDSHGIKVAQLAGIPKAVVDVAENISNSLKKDKYIH